ncbi:hypothetical protein H7Y63_00800 [Polaromonas sp.]|nr:hypothetical protein [Candidatus Saccharibacteria bacterium]
MKPIEREPRLPVMPKAVYGATLKPHATEIAERFEDHGITLIEQPAPGPGESNLFTTDAAKEATFDAEVSEVISGEYSEPVLTTEKMFMDTAEVEMGEVLTVPLAETVEMIAGGDIADPLGVGLVKGEGSFVSNDNEPWLNPIDNNNNTETVAVDKEAVGNVISIPLFEAIMPAPIAEQMTKLVAALLPEKQVEFESRIDQIIVVADRLHFLVESDQGGSKEAVQIELFLQEKLAELLVGVPEAIQEEIWQQFAAIINSDQYKLLIPNATIAIEIDSPEIVKDDELSVYAAVRQGSRRISSSLHNKLGNIALGNSYLTPAYALAS